MKMTQRWLKFSQNAWICSAKSVQIYIQMDIYNILLKERSEIYDR